MASLVALRHYRGVLCLYSYIPGSEVEDAADDGVLKVG